MKIIQISQKKSLGEPGYAHFLCSLKYIVGLCWDRGAAGEQPQRGKPDQARGYRRLFEFLSLSRCDVWLNWQPGGLRHE